MITISTLPQVTTPDQFFSIERILIPIVIPMGVTPPEMTQEIMTSYGGIVYKGQTYITTTLSGPPEGLFLKVQKGYPIRHGKLSFTYRFDGDLNKLMERGLVYNVSDYKDRKDFNDTEQFYIDKCIEPKG
jgi:hypothetical protein